MTRNIPTLVTGNEAARVLITCKKLSLIEATNAPCYGAIIAARINNGRVQPGVILVDLSHGQE